MCRYREEKDLIIINEHQSVILKCEDKIVGAVIRDAAKENIANHFGRKMKPTVENPELQLLFHQ